MQQKTKYVQTEPHEKFEICLWHLNKNSLSASSNKTNCMTVWCKDKHSLGTEKSKKKSTLTSLKCSHCVIFASVAV